MMSPNGKHSYFPPVETEDSQQILIKNIEKTQSSANRPQLTPERLRQKMEKIRGSGLLQKNIKSTYENPQLPIQVQTGLCEFRLLLT